MNKTRRVKITTKRLNPKLTLIFIIAFATLGSAFLWRSYAAPGACQVNDAITTSTYSLAIPQTAEYRIWVRMQVPDTVNTSNTNGVKLEIAGNQCFTVTSTSSDAVNQWQWINYDAAAASTPHTTTQISAGNRTVRVFGLKPGVKVDRVILLRSDSTCIPSNTAPSGGVNPGDNCTEAPPTLTLSANPTTVINGGSSTISWSTSQALACTATGGTTAWRTAKSVNGSQTVSNITSAQTFTLSCSGAGGNVSRSVTVNITTTPPSDTTPPTLTHTIPGITLPSNINLPIITRNVSEIRWQPQANDVSGIKSLTLMVNNQPATLVNGEIRLGNSSNGNGDYVLRAEATDNADNITVSTLTVKLRHPDFNRSGRVDIYDLTVLMRRWGSASTNYDLDGNGEVDLFDLSFLMRQWNSTL